MRALKWIGITLASLVGLAILGMATLLLLFDWNWLKDVAVRQASEATGRKVAIEGTLDGELAWTPRISVEGLRIANPDWASEDNLLVIDRLVFRIALRELLKGRVVLPEVALDGARIGLESRADGSPTWEFAGPSLAAATVEATVPEDRREFPIIGRLSVNDSVLTYRDRERDIDLLAQVQQATGRGGGAEERVTLTGEGTFQGEAFFTLELEAGSLLALRESEQPYPLAIDAVIGDTRLQAEGSVADPLNPADLDMSLTVEGRDLADLFPIVGIPIPPSPPYSLQAKLRREGAVWIASELAGRVGDSDLNGNLRIDAGRVPPFLEAELASARLAFEDLGGFVGLQPDGEESAAEKPDGKVLPDMDVNLERLRAMDMKVHFVGRRVLAPNLPIDDLDVRILLEGGLLRLQPLELGVAEGVIAGTLVLDGREQIPGIDADLEVRNLALKELLPHTETADLTGGRIGGQIDLAGRGRSAAEMLGASNGRVALAMVGGAVDPLIMELAGLDIAESLAVLVDEPDEPVRIRCLVGEFRVTEGVLATEALLLDTTDANLWGSGTVDLGQENLDLVFTADPKDPSLISANAPIRVSGTFAAPSIAIDPLGTEREGGLAEAIGKVINPLVALLPFVDLGLAEDTDCHGLRQQDGSPPPPTEKNASQQAETSAPAGDREPRSEPDWEVAPLAPDRGGTDP